MRRLCDGTFAEGPLQQVVFRLQFGDEITALQKLAEFLRRIERLITRRPPLRRRSAITKAGGEGTAVCRDPNQSVSMCRRDRRRFVSFKKKKKFFE